MKFISSVLACGAALTLADKAIESSDGKISVQFLGKSGNMKFRTADGMIHVKQAQLEERTEDGEKCTGGKDGCKKFTMTGPNGEWSDIIETDLGAGDKLYETIYTHSADGVEFMLSAKFSTATTVATDTIPCEVTADPTEDPTTADPTTADPTTADPTAVRRRLLDDNGVTRDMPAAPECTTSFTVTKNTLKFSFMVTGFAFQNSSNTLLYAIDLDTDLVNGTDVATEMFDLGAISFPDDGILMRAGAAVGESVAASTTFVNDTIAWKFGSFGASDVLYYDPTFTIGGGDNDDGDDDGDDDVASGSPALVAFPLVAAASVIASLL